MKADKRNQNRIIYRIALWLLFGIITINLLVLTIRFSDKQSRFSEPVPLNTKINYDWAKSQKEILFIFLKPTCPMCTPYIDSLNDLHNKYGNKIEFIGLCNPKYWNADYIAKFNFRFMKINTEMRKALHLAFTPQFVMSKDSAHQGV